MHAHRARVFYCHKLVVVTVGAAARALLMTSSCTLLAFGCRFGLGGSAFACITLRQFFSRLKEWVLVDVGRLSLFYLRYDSHQVGKAAIAGVLKVDGRYLRVNMRKA